MVLISNDICQYVWKCAVLNKNICHLLGPWPSVFSGKKIRSTETYTNLLNAVLWIFFPQNTLGYGPAFWIFSRDSRIRVKLMHLTLIDKYWKQNQKLGTNAFSGKQIQIIKLNIGMLKNSWSGFGFQKSRSVPKSGHFLIAYFPWYANLISKLKIFRKPRWTRLLTRPKLWLTNRKNLVSWDGNILSIIILCVARNRCLHCIFYFYASLLV